MSTKAHLILNVKLPFNQQSFFIEWIWVEDLSCFNFKSFSKCKTINLDVNFQGTNNSEGNHKISILDTIDLVLDRLLYISTYLLKKKKKKNRSNLKWKENKFKHIFLTIYLVAVKNAIKLEITIYIKSTI